MGYIHVEWARDVDGLDHNEKMVLILLTLRADNQNGETFVSVRRLAQEAGYSPKSKNTVRRALRSLKDRKLIDWKGQVRSGTSEQTTHKYTVHFNRVGADSNHLGADSNDVGAESNTKNRELNQEPNKSLYSPSSCDDGSDSLDTPSSDDDGPKKMTAAEADPISPTWYRSPQRYHALDLIQRLGVLKANRAPYSDTEEALIQHLNQSLRTDRFSFLLDDGSWATTLTDRHKAAIKLNQIINMARND